MLLLNLQNARTLADIIVTDKANRRDFYTEFDIEALCRKHNLDYVPMKSLVHSLNECRQVKEAYISQVDIDFGETYGGETIDVVDIRYAR